MIKQEDILAEWAKDGPLNPIDISGEGANVPKLHEKYFRYYLEANRYLRKFKTKLQKLQNDKTEYYRGDMDEADRKAKKWEPLDKHYMKADIPNIVAGDNDIIQANLAIGEQQDLVKFLEDIIKQINSRNFLIKSIIDWEKFTNGGS